jgi:hypothetical protein
MWKVLLSAIIERIRVRVTDRNHELAKLEAIFAGLMELQKEQTAAMTAVAGAAKAQADVMKQWFDSFVVTQPAAAEAPKPAAASGSGDQWLTQRQREFEANQDPTLLEGVPPEVQLAWMLKLDSPAFMDDESRA